MCRAVAEALVTRTHLVVQAGHRDRQVPGLPGPAGPLGRQDGRGHRHQGAAGPTGREGPAAGRGGARPARPAGLRRAEGTEQLHLPPAGGRDGLGWDPGGAGRPGIGPGRRGGGGGGSSARGCHPRGPGRGGPSPPGLVTDVGQRGSGRPELRAVGPGLEHAERRPPGMPGRLQLPLGWALLRRGRPRPGGGGRHRGRQHPPLRRAPGQRRGGAARARRRRLRRGARARGGHDLEPRGGGHAGPLPFPRHRGAAPGRRTRRGTCSTPWRRSASSWVRSWATASGRGSCTRTPVRRWTTASWPSCSTGPPSSAGA